MFSLILKTISTKITQLIKFILTYFTPPDCGSPSELINGKSDITGSALEYASTVGSVANYECEPGYNLLPAGDNQLTCSDVNGWEGDLGSCYSGEQFFLNVIF